MKIYLMRHGQTTYNEQKLFYGDSDVPLTEKGIQQALILREKLAKLPVEWPVYTSQTQRTIKTAQLVFPQHQITPLASLNEMGFGDWEGLNADQIEALDQGAWQAWLDDPFQTVPPGAEGFQAFRKRVLACTENLLAQERDMIFVSHLGVLRTLIQEWFPEKSFYDIRVDQGNYTVVEHQQQTFRITAWNH